MSNPLQRAAASLVIWIPGISVSARVVSDQHVCSMPTDPSARDVYTPHPFQPTPKPIFYFCCMCVRSIDLWAQLQHSDSVALHNTLNILGRGCSGFNGGPNCP